MGWRERWRDYCDRQAMTAWGFRFYEDGTVEGHGYGRAKVLAVELADGRHRKGFFGRGAAAVATGGLSLAASGYTGTAACVLVTETWTYLAQSKEIDELQRLYALALQARVRNHGADHA